MGNPVVHFEISGPDPGALARFYTELFGWQAQHMPEMDYIVINTRGRTGINGGIPPGRDISASSVTFYVKADDIQPLLDRAEALGGKTVVPVTDMGIVTFALFADPDGLVVGLVKSADAPDQQGQGPSQGDGAPVDWFEILGPDADRTQKFYTELFGWHLDTSGFPGYATVDTHAERGINGGLGAGEGAEWVTVYAHMPDVESALAKAESLGAQRVYGPNDVNEGLRTAAIRDPAGNVFGLYASQAQSS